MFQTLFTNLLILSKNNMGKNVMLPQTDFTHPTSLPQPSRKIPEKKLKTLLNCSFQLLPDFYFVVKIFVDDSTWLLCPQIKMALGSS